MELTKAYIKTLKHFDIHKDSTGYHFYIYRDGCILTTRPVERVGVHARGNNAHSIGICYEGGLDHYGLPKGTRTE